MYTEAALKEAVLGLIASLHVCSLATSGQGQPHVVSLMYAYAGFELFWFSDPATMHSRHIDAVPLARVAVTIATDHEDFTTIQGVQMVGVARFLTDPREAAAAFSLLTRRFEFLARIAETSDPVAEALHRAGIYRFTPDRVTLIDNTKGFGYKMSFIPDY